MRYAESSGTHPSCPVSLPFSVWSYALCTNPCSARFINNNGSFAFLIRFFHFWQYETASWLIITQTTYSNREEERSIHRLREMEVEWEDQNRVCLWISASTKSRSAFYAECTETVASAPPSQKRTIKSTLLYYRLIEFTQYNAFLSLDDLITPSSNPHFLHAHCFQINHTIQMHHKREHSR